MENNTLIETISTISDEDFDRVFVYKLYNNPKLLESLKRIESYEVFTPLEDLCTDELKVCFLLLLATI